MHIDENQHPDLLSDRKNFYSIDRGGRQAIEDMALKKYFEVLDSGMGQVEAEAVFNNALKNGTK